MKELAKQYDPSQVEDRIYQFWLALTPCFASASRIGSVQPFS